MALTDENGGGIPATMLVSPSTMGGGYPYPVYQNGGQGNGAFGDNNGWWLILLIILLAAGGWNGNGQNNGNGFGGGAPIIVNDGNGGGSVQRGFDQAAIMSGIGTTQMGIQALATQLCNCCCDMQNTVNQGFNATQLALCNGFAGVNQGVAGGFAQAEIAANGRQMANMNQAFAAQTAMAQGFNQLGTQFADCCCENRLATADLKYTIATENCADRYEAAQNTRDIIDNVNRNNQTILDKLCQLELDAKNDKISDLERQLTMANLSASQIAQTAQIQQGQVAEVDALYQRLRNCPVPTMPVYGNQPIFTCTNNGCGCGNNSGCGCGTF